MHACIHIISLGHDFTAFSSETQCILVNSFEVRKNKAKRKQHVFVLTFQLVCLLCCLRSWSSTIFSCFLSDAQHTHTSQLSNTKHQRRRTPGMLLSLRERSEEVKVFSRLKS